MLLTLAVPFALLALQQPSPLPQVGERLAGRVSPELAALATELGSTAAARGLPAEPIIQKAIEGSAKGVAVERVGLAMRLVLRQLEEAASALDSRDTVAIAAGAFAMTAGLSGGDIRQLARSGGGAASGELVVALRVAGTLSALGVPPAETVRLVGATLEAGRPAGELLGLPGRVQAEMSKGVSPAQAAAGLARAAAAQSRRGPPPGRGQPPPHPAPPPRP